MFEVAKLIGQLIESATAPALARRLQVFEQRVAALHNAALNDAMKRRAVIKSGARLFDELLNMLRRFVGEELEADDAEIGGDDGFERRHLLDRQWRLGC